MYFIYIQTITSKKFEQYTLTALDSIIYYIILVPICIKIYEHFIHMRWRITVVDV